MNDEYNESESFLGGKGFYIALMLCVSIIVVSAWMLVNNSGEEEAEALAEATVTPYVHQEVMEWKDPQPQTTPVTGVEPDVPDVVEVIEPQPTQEPVQEVYVPVEDDTVQTVNIEELSYVWPVIGKWSGPTVWIVWYSMRPWMTGAPMTGSTLWRRQGSTSALPPRVL